MIVGVPTILAGTIPSVVTASTAQCRSTIASLPDGLAEAAKRTFICPATDEPADSIAYLSAASVLSAITAQLAILKDKKKILPCAVYLDGEYGIKGLCVGVPVKLGRGGVEQIIEITLTPEEQAAFDKSAGAVRELVDKLKL